MSTTETEHKKPIGFFDKIGARTLRIGASVFNAGTEPYQIQPIPTDKIPESGALAKATGAVVSVALLEGTNFAINCYTGVNVQSYVLDGLTVTAQSILDSLNMNRR